MRACAFAQSRTEPSLFEAEDKLKAGHLVTLDSCVFRIGVGGGAKNNQYLWVLLKYI